MDRDVRIGVFAMGVLSPIGKYGVDHHSFWKSLVRGKSRFRPLPFDTEKHNIGAQVASTMNLTSEDEEQIARLLPEGKWRGTPTKFSRLDPMIQLAVGSTSYAMHHLKWNEEIAEVTGVKLGTGLGGGRTLEESVRDFDKNGKSRSMSFSVINTMPNAAAGQISRTFGLKGPSSCEPAACASGTFAMASACDIIRLNRAKAMVVVGAEAINTPHYIATFDQIAALSHRSMNPSVPFGKERDGFVMGEGAGTVVLADMKWAKEVAGWKPIAEIVGYATNNGANDMVQPSPDGAAKCMELALKDADVDPAFVSIINAHGTSTPVGDVAEATAIERVFGHDLVYSPLIFSTKALLGHTLGACGVIELITTILCLRTEMVHPMGDYELDPECLYPSEGQKNPLRIVTKDQRIDHPKIGMSTNFGFGDHNGVIIVSI